MAKLYIYGQIYEAHNVVNTEKAKKKKKRSILGDAHIASGGCQISSDIKLDII